MSFEAHKWFLKSAEQGHVGAQYNLGVLYQEGQGVDKDYKEAANWYQKSSEKGHAPSQNNLAFMYANGLGVNKDYSGRDRCNKFLNGPI